MDSLIPFLNALDSFTNLQQAVLRSLEEDKKKATLICSLVGLSYNSIKLRYRNPLLWRINEIRLLANHYQLPTTAFTQFYSNLPLLITLLNGVSNSQRRQFSRMCGLKINQLSNRLEMDWSVSDVLRLRQGLTQLVNNSQ
ncbi:hypothetical protein [Spirosoma endbachense]|uniref:Uncharacterized protein n=1 Tax=Spirosoma endbachense TaxID=2666025 RepID=A0A6P1W5B4_9BACT|nr:hypothetical protein [Spirosoma endbachense]QHW00216.1 hypothetical protein GJR95_36645 [Spirosoma endbachense]